MSKSNWFKGKERAETHPEASDYHDQSVKETESILILMRRLIGVQGRIDSSKVSKWL
jgi:hypothetical protein